jgi:HPt (histidine-containing phosphotransfer) domain-containing protein
MVSTAGNFGARRVERVARQLEAAAKNQDQAAVAETVARLQRESAEALGAIRERVMGVPGLRAGHAAAAIPHCILPPSGDDVASGEEHGGGGHVARIPACRIGSA